MTQFKKYMKLVFALSCLALLSSCVTSRADQFLINALTPQEKAALLFDQGVKRYNNDIVGRNDFSGYDELHAIFEDVLDLDPSHPKAAQYLDDLENYSKRRFASYITRANTLSKSSKRTEAQDYELVLLVRQAAAIKGSDKDVARLQAGTRDLERAVILKRTSKLETLKKTILGEKDPQKLLNGLRSADRLMDEIVAIDPNNKDVNATQKAFDDYVASFVGKDIESAQKLLAAQNYDAAETAILRAEKSLAIVSPEPNKQVLAIKYDIYYAWASSLLDQKKLGNAGEKADKAIAVRRSSEAVALRTKINKTVITRDYDAEIDDILSTIDALVAKDDVGGAYQAIAMNLARVNLDASKAKLNKRLDKVYARRDQIYKDAIELYNEEDYESASKKFGVVLSITEDYEQARSYLDKAQTKIRALSGSN